MISIDDDFISGFAEVYHQEKVQPWSLLLSIEQMIRAKINLLGNDIQKKVKLPFTKLQPLIKM